MEEDFDLPLSIQELAAARTVLYEKVSFLDIMKRYSSHIVDCWHSDFTHKCVCPIHANGRERTPSLYFSEKSKSFKCFSCNRWGAVFDLISIMEGSPWFYIVRDMLNSSNIDPDQVNFSELESRPVRSDLIYNANFELSTALRDYLAYVAEFPNYEEEKNWVDWMFRRIDDRFDNLDDSHREEAARFRIRINMEINRRKSSVERANQNR